MYRRQNHRGSYGKGSISYTLEDHEWGNFNVDAKLDVNYETEGPSGDGWNEPRDPGGVYINEVKVKGLLIVVCGEQLNHVANADELAQFQKYVDEQLDNCESWLYREIEAKIMKRK